MNNRKIEVVPGLWNFELKCKCGKEGCADDGIFTGEEMNFLYKLSDIRTLMNIRMKVNSFIRCPLHDYYRNGSAHCLIKNDILYSVAADIKPIGCTVEELYLFCERRGFNGLGINIYLKYLHIDDSKKRICRWNYDEDNIPQTILYKEL